MAAIPRTKRVCGGGVESTVDNQPRIVVLIRAEVKKQIDNAVGLASAQVVLREDLFHRQCLL